MALGLLHVGVYVGAQRLPAGLFWLFITTTLISMAMVLWFTVRLAHSLGSVRSAVIMLAVSGALVVPLQVMLGLGRAAGPWRLVLFVPGLPEVLLVCFSASCGVLLSRLLRSANMIPPVAAVLALVDVWTVLLGGPVQRIMTSDHPVARAVTQAMTVRLPHPTRGAAQIPPTAVIGFADFLFIAFFVAAISRFVPDRRVYLRMLWSLIILLCLYMTLVFVGDQAFGFIVGLPALVPVAIVMISLHWRYFHYNRTEAFALIYAALFIGAIALGFWLFLRPPPAARETEVGAARCAPVRTLPEIDRPMARNV